MRRAAVFVLPAVISRRVLLCDKKHLERRRLVPWEVLTQNVSFSQPIPFFYLVPTP